MFHAHFSFALNAWHPEFATAGIENNFEHLFPYFYFPVVGGQSFLQSNLFYLFTISHLSFKGMKNITVVKGISCSGGVLIDFPLNRRFSMALRKCSGFII
jgi:hypothetical protein